MEPTFTTDTVKEAGPDLQPPPISPLVANESHASQDERQAMQVERSTAQYPIAANFVVAEYLLDMQEQFRILCKPLNRLVPESDVQVDTVLLWLIQENIQGMIIEMLNDSAWLGEMAEILVASRGKALATELREYSGALAHFTGDAEVAESLQNIAENLEQSIAIRVPPPPKGRPALFLVK